MSFGFVILKLSVTGPGRPDAVLEFRRGLNVIVGPSDTGKTFISQCIAFITGAQDAPKSIPESQGYDSIKMLLESVDGSYSCELQRSLSGGNIRAISEGEERILSAKHSPNRADTVSSLLLGLSGLDGKQVRTNQQGKTRPLSFRDVAHLILIDEESVIATESPVVTGQFVSATAEARVFRLLLTGSDDSSVIAKMDPQAQKSRQEGIAEILDELIQQARKQLDELKVQASASELRDQLTKLETAVSAAGAALAREHASAADLEERRRATWIRLRETESRENVLKELQSRFDLLDAQYRSDLLRLRAVADASVRLGQMKEDRCPVCGALAEHHDHAHQHRGFDVSEVVGSSLAEAQKTEVLLRDLASTIADTNAKTLALAADRAVLEQQLEKTLAELRTEYQPRIQLAVQGLQEAQSLRDVTKRAVDILERIDGLERRLSEATAPRKREQVVSFSQAQASTGEAEEFCKEVEALLRAWNFPKLDRVTFSDSEQDIVISGRSRASHGKGVRAITHAAFSLGLLRYCSRRESPFPGLVLIDSPLVVYREPDVGDDEFPLDVKDAFYRSLATEFVDSQVVILENDPPPADVNLVSNVIEFSGTAIGRRGFFA